jgi:hypothetical protein
MVIKMKNNIKKQTNEIPEITKEQVERLLDSLAWI